MSAAVPTPRLSEAVLPSPRSAVADAARLAAVASYRLPGHAGVSDLDAVVAYMARTVEAPLR
ncbi:hypothetical protein [Geodermatophilus normandii]|uniref:Uncharacterized protein n=1 Tax=Geodermatophilus normandii TaxID=1137989 RepID=A0A6P0GC41_9ACTN|nr:hypothetical protein [Geodermatophilus normandii]NEM05444.1 hypothetical protein [Geodermatophilus normandii]